MKEYMYNQTFPFGIINEKGEASQIPKGETIITFDDKKFQYRGHIFELDKNKLKKYFLRVYSIEDKNRYDRIYENAMVAAMQSLIANLKDVKVSYDMHEFELVPKNAIWFANQLVEELKEKEW